MWLSYNLCVGISNDDSSIHESSSPLQRTAQTTQLILLLCLLQKIDRATPATDDSDVKRNRGTISGLDGDCVGFTGIKPRRRD